MFAMAMSSLSGDCWPVTAKLGIEGCAQVYADK